MPPKYSDPLSEAIKPPAHETAEEEETRLNREEEACRISQEIDEFLKQERLARKKKGSIRLLLLGQSESGKSTTLKQFQRLYTPTAFREERHLWRAVIQLNIIRSVQVIIDAISDPRSSVLSDDSEEEADPLLPADVEFLTTRLLPLRHIENLLIAKLAPPNEDQLTNVQSFQDPNSRRSSEQEVFVRPGVGWHSVFTRKHKDSSRPISPDGIETQDEHQSVLCSCRYDIITLWEHPAVQKILKRRKIRLEEQPGFYLNDLERLTSPQYMPNDNDVLKARLKTVGVFEYTFQLESSVGAENGIEWRIIDVGGSRTQRPAWAQFFDDVDAILFLAPISGFDQTLPEDRNVNRLEDSVLLWKSICSNKLLAKVELVLFLNKCDLLESKLKAGIKLSKYVRSYGNRSNDAETASKYFRSKFSALQREHSPSSRKFFGFCTSVTDTTTTAGILSIVRDVVIRQHLKSSMLL